MTYCRFCNGDPEILVLLPANIGPGSPFACIECAKKNGLYCVKHDKPHTGFAGDNTTACLRCIEEETLKARDRADEFYLLVKGALSEEEWENLSEAIEESSYLTGNEDPVTLLRFIATKAVRLHLSLDDILVRILQEQSAEFILSTWPL